MRQIRKNIIKLFFHTDVSEGLRLKFYAWFLKKVDGDLQEEALLDLWNAPKTVSRQDTLHDLRKVQVRIWGETRRRLHIGKVLVRTAATILLLLMGALCGIWLHQLVNQSADWHMVQCYVPFGEEKEMLLPDHSKVTVEQGSLIIYPEVFPEDSREIYLDGKARFDVEKDVERPFRVKTRYLSVTALGTEFLVEAYASSMKTVTTLLEGKVKVNGPGLDEILLPDEQIVYHNTSGKFAKNHVDADAIIRSGKSDLVFRSENLAFILSVLETCHHVDIQCRTHAYDNRLLTVRFSQDETLEQSLKILSNVVEGMEYTIQGDVVIIE